MPNPSGRSPGRLVHSARIRAGRPSSRMPSRKSVPCVVAAVPVDVCWVSSSARWPGVISSPAVPNSEPSRRESANQAVGRPPPGGTRHTTAWP